MKNSILYDGLDRAGLIDVLSCFCAKIKKYLPGETVVSYPTTDVSENTVGIILSGTARMYVSNYFGDEYLSHIYEGEGVFGAAFINPSADDCYTIIAQTELEVAYTTFERISEFCENACINHMRFTKNVYRLIADQSKKDLLRLNIVSKKTIREKLLAYFLVCSEAEGSFEFNINVTLSELSKYVCSERSAMMRELRKMNDDGILVSKGSHVKLLRPYQSNGDDY